MEIIQGLSLNLGLDTAGVDMGLKQLRGKLAQVNSEMKANMSAFDYGERSVAKYQTQLNGLNRKLEVQKAAVSAARAQYERMVAEHGEGSVQAARAATAYNNEVAAVNNLQRHINNLTEEFQDFQREQEEANSTLLKLNSSLEALSARIARVGEGMQDMGKKLTTGISAPLAALGAGAGLAALDFEKSNVKIQNSLDITADKAKELTNISKKIYKDGFGESTEEIDAALVQTKQNIRNLNDADLEKVTKKAFTLADTFDSEVNEVTRAANTLINNYGMDVDAAFDLMAKGAKRGMNFSNEMFDNMAEYTISFKEAGFSAQEMFSILSNGAKKGYNLDRLNDTMLEFKLQSEDTSKSYMEGIAGLSEGTRKVFKDYQEGKATVADFYKAVIPDLEKLRKTLPEAEFNTIGKALFGTKWEDQGADVVLSMKTVNKELENTNGTMNSMTENVEKSFGVRVSAAWRKTKDALLPLGNVLLTMAETWLPKVESIAEKVSEKFSNMSPASQKLTVIFGLIAAAIGPVVTALGFFISGMSAVVGVIARLIGPISTAIGWLSKLGPAFTAIRTAIGVLSGPIGWVTLAVTALAVVVYKNWDSIKAKTVEIFTAIGGFLKTSWTSIKDSISLLVTNIKDGIAQKWTETKNKTVEIFNGIKTFLSTVWNGIKTTVSTIVTGISSWVANTWQKIQAVTSTVFNAIKTFLSTVWNGYRTIIATSVNTIRTVVTTVWNAIRTATSTIFNAIRNMLNTVWSAVKKTVTTAAVNIKDGVIGAWNTLKTNTSNIFTGIKKTLSGLWDDIVSGAKKLPGRIGDGLKQMASGVGKGVKAVGNKLAEGLENGLNGAINGINWVLKKINAPLLDHPLKIKRYFGGTKGHPGGPAIVGDSASGGDGPAELIGTPDGNMYLSPAKKTLIPDLPKGSWVMPGKETKAFLSSIPAYHGGVGDIVSGIADKAKGVAGTVKNAITSGAGKVKDLALDVWEYLDDVPGMMKKVWNNFIPDMGLTSTMADLAKGGITKVKDGALDWIKEKVSSIFVGDGWTGDMEKDPRAVGPGSGFGGMMKYVEHWYNQVKNRFGPTRFMGAYNNRNVRGGSSKSMHAYGRAFDIGGSHATMSKIAEFLRNTASNLQYVIYNRKIAGPGVGKSWRRYNGVNPHVDHVHADFLPTGGGGGGIPGGKISGNLSSWITAAMSKAGVSGSNWLQGLAWIINKESSGRPRAVGAMTSTGTAKGLMQLKDFNYKGNPFDPVNNIFYGIKYILGRYKSIEGALSWWKKHNWYAKGTNFHKGGPAVVNDQKGSLFKELIQLPSGIMGMFEGRNVQADLPKGTKVIPALETKRLMQASGITHYATGTGKVGGSTIPKNVSSSPAAQTMTYIVKAGDTLSAIAKRFKTTVEELVKLNNIKDKNKIQVGQKIVYSKDAPKTGQVVGQVGKPVLQVPQKPAPDTRPQYAKDVTYLMGKAAKEEDAQLAQMKKELNNKIVELEKEKAAKIKAINEKAAKSNKELLEKEKETQKKIKAIQDKAAKSKRGLTSKEKEQIQKLRATYEKAVNNNKNLTKKDKEQIKKINDDYAKKERAAVNAHNKQISEIERAAQQKRMQEIDAYVSRKKEAGKLSLYDEIQVYRESMRYYKKNSEEWFAAEQKLNQAKVQMHNELKALKDDYLAKVKEVNQRVIDEEKRLNDEYNRALEDRTNAIKGAFGLFDEVAKPEEELDPQGLIDNLHSQVYALNNWRTNLDALANRGIDKGLLEELQAMGPQALAEIKALNDMTDTQLNQFQGLWKDKTEAARLQAQKELSGLKQDTIKQIEQLHKDAEKELDELNKTFIQKVTELRTGAVNEFQPFGAQLVDIGKNAIQGLIDGMKSMNSPLKSVAGGLAETIKKAITDSLVIKSPSRWMKSMVGENVVQGVIDGISGMKRAATSAASTMADWFKPDLEDNFFDLGNVALPTIQSLAGNKRTDVMKLLALTAKNLDSGISNGNSKSTHTQLPNVSTQNNQEINVYLTYNGSASREDMLGLVDFVEEELAKRARIKRLMNGVEE